MQENASSTPFYSHTLTAGELSQLNDGNQVQFYISLEPGDGPATVALSYQEDQSDLSSAQCNAERVATVTPTTGARPSAGFLDALDEDADAVGVRFSAPGGCLLTRPVPAAITVRGS